jgi:hypothetical protein
MTTVIDPSGTPIPVYNKSGQTIDFYTVTGGSSTITPTGQAQKFIKVDATTWIAA